jgi:hypothetical protein
MQYTDQEEAQFVREFSKTRRRALLLSIPLIAWLVSGPFGFWRWLDSGNVWMNTTLALVAFTVVTGRLIFRCPACRAFVGQTDFWPDVCPECGIKLH